MSPKKKSSGVKSGDYLNLAGQFCGPPHPVHLFGYIAFNKFRIFLDECRDAHHVGSTYSVLFPMEHFPIILANHFAENLDKFRR